MVQKLLKWVTQIQRARGDVIAVAQRHGLDYKIVAAVVYQESKGDPFAIRYEHAFFKRYILSLDRTTLPGFVPASIPTLATEKRLRAHSFGLMQIMGETAREYGYKKNYLTKLLNPKDNLEMGCKILKSLIDKQEGTKDQQLIKALKRYNGGEDYPGIVLAHVENGNYRKVL